VYNFARIAAIALHTSKKAVHVFHTRGVMISCIGRLTLREAARINVHRHKPGEKDWTDDSSRIESTVATSGAQQLRCFRNTLSVVQTTV